MSYKMREDLFEVKTVIYLDFENPFAILQPEIITQKKENEEEKPIYYIKKNDV